MPAFFHHFIGNVRAEQNVFGGSVPFVVPTPKTLQNGSSFDMAPVMKAWLERIRPGR